METTPTPEVNPIKEENRDYIRWLKRIGRKKEMKFGFVGDSAHIKGMYKPLMQSNKLWRTDDDIRDAVYLWDTNRVEAEKLYGHISDWVVSSVTDMSELFTWMMKFNDDISRWDVSNVTNMHHAFFHARGFNQNIGSWNVSKVINMIEMFGDAVAFNQPIGGWNVSNVTDMSGMFNNARSFNQPIGDWDVSNVTDMSGMFNNALTFNQNINGWDVNNVIDHDAMFGGICLISNVNKPRMFQTPPATCIGSGCTITGGRGAKKSRRTKHSTRNRSRKSRRTKKRGTRRRRI